MDSLSPKNRETQFGRDYGPVARQTNTWTKRIINTMDVPTFKILAKELQAEQRFPISLVASREKFLKCDFLIT
jgi:hypothetical protein